MTSICTLGRKKDFVNVILIAFFIPLSSWNNRKSPVPLCIAWPSSMIYSFWSSLFIECHSTVSNNLK